MLRKRNSFFVEDNEAILLKSYVLPKNFSRN